MKDDFECLPGGTKERLEQLENYARQVSDALHKMATGGRYDVPEIPVAGQMYADPLFCAARVETRIRNAGHRPHSRFA